MPATGAFFNPALAAASTFLCAGSSLRDYIQVYWLGPLTGELYQGWVLLSKCFPAKS